MSQHYTRLVNNLHRLHNFHNSTFRPHEITNVLIQSCVELSYKKVHFCQYILKAVRNISSLYIIPPATLTSWAHCTASVLRFRGTLKVDVPPLHWWLSSTCPTKYLPVQTNVITVTTLLSVVELETAISSDFRAACNTRVVSSWQFRFVGKGYDDKRTPNHNRSGLSLGICW